MKLGSNENPLGANPNVLKAVAKAMPRVSLYPDGSNREVRKALAAAYKVNPEQVMVGNGSDEVLLMLALAFVKPGERVIVSENTFSEYEFSGRVLDGKIVKVPLRNFRYDLTGFEKTLKLKPKMMFLCNPNNPTGTVYTDEVQRALAESGRLPVEAFNRDFRTRLATGSLLAIDNQVDTATRTVRLKAVFPNEDDTLFPNQFVNVRMLVDVLKGATVVPVAAVQRGSLGTIAFVAKDDNTVSLRKVETGP